MKGVDSFDEPLCACVGLYPFALVAVDWRRVSPVAASGFQDPMSTKGFKIGGQVTVRHVGLGFALAIDFEPPGNFAQYFPVTLVAASRDAKGKVFDWLPLGQSVPR